MPKSTPTHSSRRKNLSSTTMEKKEVGNMFKAKIAVAMEDAFATWCLDVIIPNFIVQKLGSFTIGGEIQGATWQEVKVEDDHEDNKDQDHEQK